MYYSEILLLSIYYFSSSQNYVFLINCGDVNEKFSLYWPLVAPRHNKLAELYHVNPREAFNHIKHTIIYRKSFPKIPRKQLQINLFVNSPSDYYHPVESFDSSALA